MSAGGPEHSTAISDIAEVRARKARPVAPEFLVDRGDRGKPDGEMSREELARLFGRVEVGGDESETDSDAALRTAEEQELCKHMDFNDSTTWLGYWPINSVMDLASRVLDADAPGTRLRLTQTGVILQLLPTNEGLQKDNGSI